ncbi:prevent-host-death family protein [Xenococcus sp. PCC 7305]|uniref:type II toxin-antitoxin system Phd/YefM family antitoxin n=1 Tax=Xenococcus sp. PCC 7305 TaxID=102125 RepID=UPI0002AC0AB4|nr:type II toxin-antitoxin system prevent-host-death family antitoxin [Xenococcus sp. PCC 7305]ELS00531.1 prevent-host-death family protein [Xenococcus sp. PCC 7305]
MAQNREQVGAGEFKTHCLKLIDRVNQTKQPITITKHGKPMAQLTPIEDENYSLFGCLANTVEFHGDIVESIGEVWEVDV